MTCLTPCLPPFVQGVINVVKILVHIVRDIAKNNKDTLAEQLVDIMKDILPQLSVPGKEKAEFSVDALNGNDSIIFLNRFDEIVGRMLGVCAADVLDDDEQRAEEARCVDLLWAALTELRATDETVDKALTVSEKHLKNLQQHPGYVSLAADGIHGRRRRR